MESEEVFLGFHKTSRIGAETLFNLIKSSLMIYGLSLSGVRGQRYDGASNMLDRHNGFQAKVLTENSKAIYLYCFGHQLNLVVQDSLKSIPEVALALARMNAVIHFIRNSPKKLDKFKDMVAQVEVEETPLNYYNLRSLCPTLWVMHSSS